MNVFITGKLQKNFGKTTWKTYNNRFCRHWNSNSYPRWNNNGDSNNLEEITKVNIERDPSHLTSTTPIHQGGMCKIPRSDNCGTWLGSIMDSSRAFCVMYCLWATWTLTWIINTWIIEYLDMWSFISNLTYFIGDTSRYNLNMDIGPDMRVHFNIFQWEQ